MKKIMVLPIAASVAAALSLPAQADITVYKKDDKNLAFGGRVQLQYRDVDVDGGDSTSDLGFRRLRTFLKGNINKNTAFKIQGDFGAGSSLDSSSDFNLVDGYVENKFANGGKIRWGNSLFPFSREELTSSKKQHIIERTLVGSGNSGSPGRNLNIQYFSPRKKGETKFVFNAAVGIAQVDQSTGDLDINTTVNGSGSSSNGTVDDPEGFIIGGRAQFFPQGFFKDAQGDLKHSSPKFGFAVAAYNWSNDGDDNVPGDSDQVDDITGFELSGAYRGHGVSVDAQYNMFDSSLETVPGAATGLYDANGDADLEVFSLEGGYMVIPQKLEIAAAYSMQDADTYTTEYTETSFGVNYFVKGHNLKYQLSYTMVSDEDGVEGNDEDILRLQAQLVF